MPNEFDKVKSIEDALKVVDKSTLSPVSAPTSNLQNHTESRMVDMGYVDYVDYLEDDELPARPSVDKAKIPRPSKAKKVGFFESILPDRGSSKKHVSVPAENENNDLDMGPDDFKVKFDFETAYRDVPENKPLRFRREKRTGLIGGLLLATFVICVSIALASTAWIFTMDVLGFGSVDEVVNVTIPNDFSIESVAEILYEAGVIRHRAVFLLYAEFSEAEDRIVPGSFVLNRNFDYRAIVQGMTPRAGVRVETTVTIPEGLSLAQIFELLDRAEVTPAAELWEAATYHNFDFHFLDRSTLGDRLRLEGFLFPETYNFFKNSSATSTISRMLREFNRRFTEEYVERAYEMGYTVHEIVTIASMIEREAGDDAERPRIAAVIYNRLYSPNFPFLQIDATIVYAIQGTAIPFSTRVDSPFNTYTHEGLPPGPIANPGIASIRAALFPASTNEFFYALNNYGTHNFFTNYTDHRNFVNSPDFGG